MKSKRRVEIELHLKSAFNAKDFSVEKDITGLYVLRFKIIGKVCKILTHGGYFRSEVLDKQKLSSDINNFLAGGKPC